MQESTASDTESHAIAASARDCWLLRLGDGADRDELRWLRGVVVADERAIADSGRARLRRWLDEGAR